jgi:tripartite-type tricarboxylate transporter receptor subunit TctC
MRLVLAWLLAMVMSATALATEPYPSLPIRIIVPNPAGGITDTIARFLADGLRSKLNATIIVENKAGGISTIGLRK